MGPTAAAAGRNDTRHASPVAKSPSVPTARAATSGQRLAPAPIRPRQTRNAPIRRPLAYAGASDRSGAGRERAGPAPRERDEERTEEGAGRGGGGERRWRGGPRGPRARRAIARVRVAPPGD